MLHIIAIDWLSLFCTSPTGVLNTEPNGAWGYKKMPYGTRQYKELYEVYFMDEKLCEVQQLPCSSVLRARSLIVKWDNRQLYVREFWDRLDRFLIAQNLTVQNISRIDICADFNRFKCSECVPFIQDFMSHKTRHIGRGVGAAHFNHGGKNVGGFSHAYLNYTGLSFGSHSSDTRVYLYNKTFELLTQGDKPWIRDQWAEVGLTNSAEKPVWRLEVSLKSKAMKFKDKKTRTVQTIDVQRVRDHGELADIYYMYVNSLFQFIMNRNGITNVTREPRLPLFDGAPKYVRAFVRNVSPGNRAERILIKKLWQMADMYRGKDMVEDEGVTKLLATELSECTDLKEWLKVKKNTWDKPSKK